MGFDKYRYAQKVLNKHVNALNALRSIYEQMIGIERPTSDMRDVYKAIRVLEKRERSLREGLQELRRKDAERTPTAQIDFLNREYDDVDW